MSAPTNEQREELRRLDSLISRLTGNTDSEEARLVRSLLDALDAAEERVRQGLANVEFWIDKQDESVVARRAAEAALDAATRREAELVAALEAADEREVEVRRQVLVVRQFIQIHVRLTGAKRLDADKVLSLLDDILEPAAREALAKVTEEAR